MILPFENPPPWSFAARLRAVHLSITYSKRWVSGSVAHFPLQKMIEDNWESTQGCRIRYASFPGFSYYMYFDFIESNIVSWVKLFHKRRILNIIYVLGINNWHSSQLATLSCFNWACRRPNCDAHSSFQIEDINLCCVSIYFRTASLTKNKLTRRIIFTHTM